MNALFVYGTLMPGEPRWAVLADAALSWCDATAAGTLYDTGSGYPAAVFGGDGVVHGVAVVVDPARWSPVVDVLDAVEDEGRLFRRIPVDTSAGPATTYEWVGDTTGMPALRSGWRSRTRS